MKTLEKLLFSRWSKYFFGIVIIITFISDTVGRGWAYASLKLAIVSILVILGFIILKKFGWQLIRWLQIIGFGSLFLWAFFAEYLPNGMSSILFKIAGISIVFSILFKMALPKRKAKSDSLEDRIKSDLKITSTTIKKSFWKPLNFIGGFVVPAIPFITILNKTWKKRLDDEAVIHENVHLYYLQNGWLFFVLIGVLVMIVPLSYFFGVVRDNLSMFTIPLFVLFLVHFEYITFRKTNRIGDSMGIATRKWSKRIAFAYFIIYLVQVFIAYFLLQIIQKGIAFVMGFL